MNDKITEIVEKTANETGFETNKVKKVVENLFCFLRNSMVKLEYKRYYIPKFGNFNVIPKRYMKYMENHNMLTDTNDDENAKPKKRNLKAKDYVKNDTNNNN